MTDNKIIKALEHNASKCKFYEDGHDGGLFESTLDLINRQQTKIEALQMDNKQLQSDIINANQNWDHIKGLLECEKEKVESAKQKVVCACKMLKTAKSEARKEFAERLKEKLLGMGTNTTYGKFKYGVVKSYEIDNLVKEMEG